MDMNAETKQDLIDKYNELLVTLETQNIEATKYGFIEDNCNTMLFSILIHCMENLEIFTSNQLTNIYSFINKLSYAG